MRRLAPALLAAIAGGLALAPSSHALTFAVNSVADEPATGLLNDAVCDSDPGPGTICTLRAAVQETNAIGGADLILLPNLGARYELDEAGTGEEQAFQGDLDLRGSATVQGTGQPVVDAMGIDRVFHVGPNATGSGAALTGLEVRGGDNVERGGGILVESGALSLNQVTVADNIASSAAVAEGGGIRFESGANTVSNSTVSANQAVGLSATGGGIGIAAGVSVTLTNSTVSDNSATGSAGGGRGGGIWAGGGASLNHVTMSADTATGAPAEGGLVFAQGGSLAFHATILDQGVAGPGTENCEAAGGGSLITAGANLEALGAGPGTQCGLSSSAGDRFAIDGGVTSLANRGGPTQTHALFNGSPALDAIPSCFPITSDQRGEPRPGGPACEIGSFERQILGNPADKCFDREPTIVGTAESERIFGTPKDDVIETGGGNDVVKAREGDDRICVGKGKDRAFGAAGDDRLEGEQGRDKLFGQGGEDRLLGGPARDTLVGGAAKDFIDGGPGESDNCRGGSRDRERRCE